MVVTAFICDVVRLGFLGTVNSSSPGTVGGSLNLVAQAIDHFRYFVLLHIMCGYQCDKVITKNDTREVI